MRILITGGTGLIGNALRVALEADGHTCLALSRTRGENHVYWNPKNGEIEAEKLHAVEAVVNLAGSNIACRWTASAKREIRESRVSATTLLCRTLASLSPRPRVLVSASAIGYYGIAPEGILHEDAPAADSFLASVCKEWEQATATATAAGIRTVLLRTGIVLTPEGGALKKMLPAFKAGGGGVLGDGKQWMSWIALDDLTALIRFSLLSESLQGPLNAVAPQAVTNADFSHTLGAVLGRPARLRIPPVMLKMMYGQMAEETLLSSARCSADKATASGFRFAFPSLEPALKHLLATG